MGRPREPRALPAQLSAAPAWLPLALALVSLVQEVEGGRVSAGEVEERGERSGGVRGDV